MPVVDHPVEHYDRQFVLELNECNGVHPLGKLFVVVKELAVFDAVKCQVVETFRKISVPFKSFK